MLENPPKEFMWNYEYKDIPETAQGLLVDPSLSTTRSFVVCTNSGLHVTATLYCPNDDPNQRFAQFHLKRTSGNIVMSSRVLGYDRETLETALTNIYVVALAIQEAEKELFGSEVDERFKAK